MNPLFPPFLPSLSLRLSHPARRSHHRWNGREYTVVPTLFTGSLMLTPLCIFILPADSETGEKRLSHHYT
jgi:hypothetical protein